jgi:enoyl-CoA hydratase/carnithine racemase
VIERPFKLIEAKVHESAAVITLKNPARKNAIGPVMVNELLHALEGAAFDDDVRSVVITGAGDAFCSGGDFSQMVSGPGEDELPLKGDYADLLYAMVRSSKPIVARVNGVAMGGGLGIVAASHFAVAVDSAKLATPEINVGLFPMMIMAVLSRVVPKRKLLEMMLFGEKLTADEALAVGLVGKVVPADGLDAAVAEITTKIASKSPITVKLGLEAYEKQGDMDLEHALPYLRERLGACLSTDDAREGLTAFLEKRKPVWTGK